MLARALAVSILILSASGAAAQSRPCTTEATDYINAPADRERATFHGLAGCVASVQNLIAHEDPGGIGGGDPEVSPLPQPQPGNPIGPKWHAVPDDVFDRLQELGILADTDGIIGLSAWDADSLILRLGSTPGVSPEVFQLLNPGAGIGRPAGPAIEIGPPASGGPGFDGAIDSGAFDSGAFDSGSLSGGGGLSGPRP
jgi:hypothetical protein